MARISRSRVRDEHGGFTTAWVTNQECSGGPWSVQQLFGSAADTLTGNAYRLHQTNDMFLSDSLFYDERILPNLLSFEQIAPKHRRSRGLFSVVHLMGSHAGYANRYPASFARFKLRMFPALLQKGRKRKSRSMPILYFTMTTLLQKSSSVTAGAVPL